MINFNANPQSDKYTPAPDGDYFVTVIEAEEKKAKSGRDMIVLDMVIALGPCEGKPIRHYLTFIEAGADGHGITLHALHAFGFPHDGSVNLSAADFKGRTVKVKLEQETYNGRNKNVIREFYIMTDEQMAAEGRAVADAPPAEEVPADDAPPEETPAEETAPPAAAPKATPKPAAAAPKAAAKAAAAAAPARKLPWKK